MSIKELGNILGNPLGLTRIAEIRGEITYAIPGTYYWTAPIAVTSVCVVCVGGGAFYTGGSGGGGGGLGWKNGIHVVPGTSYTVTVGAGGCQVSGYNAGGDSWFISPGTVKGGGGSNATGGTYIGDGGGNGGGSAGGAGGYSGNGGDGGSAGTGGGGAGGYVSDSGAGGGGVGLFGEGASGSSYGEGGSGGSSGLPGSIGNYSGQSGLFGGGICYSLAGSKGVRGGSGAVRILWGAGRSFPSTDVGA